MDAKLYFDERKVSKLQNEAIETISKGRDFLRLNLKKIFDAVLDEGILKMKIFWKNDDGVSVNFVQHIIEKANLYATDMNAEICDVASLLLTPVTLICNDLNVSFSFEMDGILANEIKAEYMESLTKATELFTRVKETKSLP